ncbi:MarR family winged helix-turn-helix transcriptional regulator [Acidipropionibacterium timonense]|uniref:MarR family winged helix-turn-helix transcriptional regulator n=1 Tax=Acidipropionibacterium timonense TaxID=2161818 RepID=UPI001FD916BB|nr:MarR family transcriptional regulator [Acidipropionibacterium timonense]
MTDNPDGPLTTEDFAADLALFCGRLQRHAKRLAGIPASSVTWRVLHILEVAGTMSVSELTRAEGNSPSTTTDLLARLDREGLVVRRRHPEDARTRLVELTEAGHEYCRVSERRLGAGLAPVLESLDGVSREALEAALPVIRRLVDDLEGSARAARTAS